MNRVLVELESAEDAISEALGVYEYKKERAVFEMADKAEEKSPEAGADHGLS